MTLQKLRSRGRVGKERAVYHYQNFDEVEIEFSSENMEEDN